MGKEKRVQGLTVLAAVTIVSFAVILGARYLGESSAADGEKSGYKAGSYEGTGEGMGGSVRVVVTFSDEKITGIEVMEHLETPYISDPAIEMMPDKIIEAQSVDVDVVSGATVTSNAIKEAVNDAIAQAAK